MTLLGRSIAYNACVIAVSASWLWFLLRRRDQWLRYTAKEADFWLRLGLSASFVSANRRFAEGRGIVYFAAGGLLIGLLCLLVSVGFLLYFKFVQLDRLPNKGAAANRRSVTTGEWPCDSWSFLTDHQALTAAVAELLR